MSLTDKQRESLIAERGEPMLSIEFDVWEKNKVSMWTHFNHADDFNEVKQRLIAIRTHIDEFLRDENMCPFRKGNKNIVTKKD